MRLLLQYCVAIFSAMRIYPVSILRVNSATQNIAPSLDAGGIIFWRLFY